MSQSEKKENVMKYKLAYTGLILLVYILGKCIPLYGLERADYSEGAVSVEDVLMQTIGGDANKSSIFALGIFPFMISSLLVQIGFAFRRLFTKTPLSPKTMGRVMAIVTIIIAVMQTIVQTPQLKFAVPEEELLYARIIASAEMVTGVMIMLWLSERNGKYGVGGRMIVGLVNILERVIGTVLRHDPGRLVIPLAIALVMLLITLLMENGEMRIPVQRVSIHNVYADKNYMAIKLNPVGVMPMMFTTAVFMLPRLIVSLLGDLFPESAGIAWWQDNMNLTSPAGITVYIACEYLLTIGFAFIMINPKDQTENFLKSGDSIVNLHAGRDTKRYLSRVMWCISFISATIMGGCLLVPLILQLRGNMDSTLTMLPTSIMMMTSFWCTISRELISIHKYDSCRPLF
ncbi:MAG: preprotein translocase subunit SecY [Lachnospiraceae bacterium]|nr:preprotein translocase subunit SecY [Lachnospiraceae bacterium]